MGLFSRNRVAKKLDITPARVSQMTTAGVLSPPIPNEDGTETGYPETQVEELAARRAGRRTSKSIFGIPPQTEPATLAGDTLAEGAFVQLLKVDVGTVGLITPLEGVTSMESPFMDQIDYGQTIDSHNVVEVIDAAAKQLDVDPFEISWVITENWRASDVVVIDEPDHDRNVDRYRYGVKPRRNVWAKTERITWETLHQKLGRPVPILGAATAQAVEEWSRAGRQPTTVVMDWNRAHYTALAGGLLAGVAANTGPEAKQAIALALARIQTQLDWEVSGSIANNFLAKSEGDHVELITQAAYPPIQVFRNSIDAAAAESPHATEAERQEAANCIGSLQHLEFGPYGRTPDAALSRAMDFGISVLIHDLTEEMMGGTFTHIERPVYYELRTYRPARAQSWSAYRATLKPARSAEDPAARQLLAQLTPDELHKHMQGGATMLLTDPAGNYSLERYTRDGDAQELITAVPVARFGPAKRVEFDEIIVEPDTQKGPIMLIADGAAVLMPFGTPRPHGFTHGYSGSGPRALTEALCAFLEWHSDTTLTPAGRNHIGNFVWTADQDSQLRITRNQIFRPGVFATPATPS